METLYEIYDTYWYKYADPRMIEYPLMGSPIPLLIIMTAYWCVIKKGPQWMANRPAFNIKLYIQIYNITQIALCSTIPIRVIYLISQGNLRCMTHYTSSEYDRSFLFYMWVYSMIKVLDLLDTVFFIMRKRFALVTNLHTYHHTLMVVSCLSMGRYFPAGEYTILGVLNSLVHAVMYFYYFYCLYNDSKQNIWWKKHITQLQMGQFVFILFYFLYKLLFVHDCDYPKILIVLGITQTLTMLYMFGNYYYSAFIKPVEPKKVK